MVSHLAAMESEWNIHEHCECAIYIFQFQVIHDSQWTSRDTLNPTVRLFSPKSFVKTSVTGLGQPLQSNSMRLTSPQAASLQLATRDKLQENIVRVASPLCNLQGNKLQQKNSLLLFATLRDSS